MLHNFLYNKYIISTMNHLLLKLITLLHIMLVLFVVIVPFTNSHYFLMLHAIFVPFMVIHWLLNNHMCALTLVEKYVRKKVYKEGYAEEDCITCKLIEPIYDFNNDTEMMAKVVYAITIFLWFVSAGKLMCRYKSGQFSSVKELFML